MRAPLAASLLVALGLGAALLALPVRTAALAQGAPPDDVAEGKRVYQKANCIGCHKWHGGGGGGYGGDALSLRATALTRDQIIETVSCGRPGTGMPYFQRGAYDSTEHPCYGVSRQDLGKTMPLEAPGSFLRPAEIAAVADYVIADVKGRGDPTYADCAAFFGDGARVCNVYRPTGASAASGEPQPVTQRDTP
jgi:mono/diheme cytochrome c family protein